MKKLTIPLATTLSLSILTSHNAAIGHKETSTPEFLQIGKAY